MQHKLFEWILITSVKKKSITERIAQCYKNSSYNEILPDPLYVQPSIKCVAPNPETSGNPTPHEIENFLHPHGICLTSKHQEPFFHQFVLSPNPNHLYGSTFTKFNVLTQKEIFEIQKKLRKKGCTQKLPQGIYYSNSISLISFQPFHATLLQILVRFASSLSNLSPFDKTSAEQLFSILTNATKRIPEIEFSSDPPIITLNDISIQIPYWDYSFKKLPMHDINFIYLFSTLDSLKIIQLFIAILNEKNIVMISEDLSKITSCSEAFFTLLYPFEWTYTYIPILPQKYIQIMESPSPFFVGGYPSMLDGKIKINMSETVFVDLDANEIYSKAKIGSIPKRCVLDLLYSLKQNSNIFVKEQEKKIKKTNIYWKTNKIQIDCLESEFENIWISNAEKDGVISPDEMVEIEFSTLSYSGFSSIDKKFKKSLQSIEKERKSDYEIRINVPLIREDFLSIFLEMFRFYHHFRYKTKFGSSFNSEEFFKFAPNDCVPFLKIFLKSQMFTSFIEERKFDHFDFRIYLEIEQYISQYKENKFMKTEIYYQNQQGNWNKHFCNLESGNLIIYLNENSNENSNEKSNENSNENSNEKSNEKILEKIIINEQTELHIPNWKFRNKLLQKLYPIYLLQKQKQILISFQSRDLQKQWAELLKLQCLSFQKITNVFENLKLEKVKQERKFHLSKLKNQQKISQYKVDEINLEIARNIFSRKGRKERKVWISDFNWQSFNEKK